MNISETFIVGQNSDSTRISYSQALKDFAAYVQLPRDAAVDRFLAEGEYGANAQAESYRVSLMDRKLAPATINARVSVLRELVEWAKKFGVVNWSLDVKSLKSETMRDTRGCGLDGFKALLGATGDKQKDKRDRAMLRLMFDMALRRGTVANLDLQDVDLAGLRLNILPKGKTQKIWKTMAQATCDAIVAWLEVHPRTCDALFVGLDRASGGKRLDGGSIWRVVNTLGRKLGMDVHPHSLRHAACTTALDMTNGDVRSVRLLMGHANVATTMIYDDNRRDISGKMSNLLAGA